MTLANQDDRSYARRFEVKASAARRPTLDCGCPNDGRLTYLRGTCDHIVCGVHADGHECAGQVPEEPAEPLPQDRIETLTWSPQPCGKAGGVQLLGGILTDEVGEAATQSPTQIVCSSCGLPTGPGLLHWCPPKRSWFSRLWRWMWLRG
jgi:hypothetical protein